ncbi:hypothetical protein [Rhizobium sp. UGM030330-04]|uniref:hypothetical protein n=1 Tax=Pseudomonadota TaxID=1224 RepID=UPI001144CF1B|nr:MULTISPECIES: hypothetical protein [Pseudomonadota]
MSIDDLVTHKSKTKINASVVYSNSNRSGFLTKRGFIVGTNKVGQDVFINTVSFHYGLTKKIEVHGRGSFLYSSVRVRSRDTIVEKTETSVTNIGRFGDSWLGVNYRLKEDDATPGIILSTEAALWERFGTNVVFLKSFTVGMTAYKAIDPIIFSCDAGYQISLRRNNGEHDVRPGGLLWVSPSVSFVANNRVTLATGFRWSGRGADRHYGNKQPEVYQTQTDLQLGVGYNFSKDTALNVRLMGTLSGGGSSQIGFSWVHTF